MGSKAKKGHTGMVFKPVEACPFSYGENFLSFPGEATLGQGNEGHYRQRPLGSSVTFGIIWRGALPPLGWLEYCTPLQTGLPVKALLEQHSF